MEAMKIVVADDEKRVCDLICALIDWEGLGLELVGAVNDGQSALRVIKETDPDLVITDVRMPGLDGLSLIEQAKAYDPSLQFIIISGYRQFDYAQSAISFGVAEYLLKPINKEELNHTLARMRDEHLRQLSAQETQRQTHDERSFLLKGALVTFLERGETRALEPWGADKQRLRFVVIGLCGTIDEQVARLMETKSEAVVHRFEKDAIVSLFDTRLWVLCSLGDDELEVLVDELSLLLKKGTQTFHALSYTIAMGIPVLDVAHLQVSRQSAVEAAARRLIDPQLHIFFGGQPLDEDLAPHLEAIHQIMQKHCVSRLDRSVEEELKLCLSGQRFQSLSAYGWLQICQKSFDDWCSIVEKDYPTERLSEAVRHQGENQPSLSHLREYLASSLAALVDEYHASKESQAAKPIRTAIDHIEANFRSDLISLESVSEVVGLNSSYFSALFKRSTGVGFAEYLLDLRMSEVKRLLVETNRTIAQIALDVGYHDPKHLARLFKKHYQIKPNEYRKLYG